MFVFACVCVRVRVCDNTCHSQTRLALISFFPNTAPLFNLPVPDLPEPCLIFPLQTVNKAPSQPGRDFFLLIS